jgi:hypothetical protein
MIQIAGVRDGGWPRLCVLVALDPEFTKETFDILQAGADALVSETIAEALIACGACMKVEVSDGVRGSDV